MTGNRPGESTHMRRRLKAWATNRGYDIAWGSVVVLDEVQAEFEGRRRAGELDEDFDRERLSWFRYPEGMPIPNARSVIVIVVPRPAHTVTFKLEDGELSAVIPPTYVRYDQTREAVRRELATRVFRDGQQLHVLPAPLKAVAARLGIVVYGRNNITYSSRFGSYHQLIGLITDAELGSATDWRPTPPRVLSKCESCNACRRACPTGAISRDRFLLHAERCLTLHTEASGPWPAHLSPSVHHCLVGCMYCQETCPENAGLFRLESTGVSFSADETATILAGDGPPRVSAGRTSLQRLTDLGLDDYAEMLGRNLRALVEQRNRDGGDHH